jgi:hypothetical protein
MSKNFTQIGHTAIVRYDWSMVRTADINRKIGEFLTTGLLLCGSLPDHVKSSITEYAGVDPRGWDRVHMEVIHMHYLDKRFENCGVEGLVGSGDSERLDSVGLSRTDCKFLKAFDTAWLVYNNAMEGSISLDAVRMYMDIGSVIEPGTVYIPPVVKYVPKWDEVENQCRRAAGDGLTVNQYSRFWPSRCRVKLVDTLYHTALLKRDNVVRLKIVLCGLIISGKIPLVDASVAAPNSVTPTFVGQVVERSLEWLAHVGSYMATIESAGSAVLTLVERAVACIDWVSVGALVLSALLIAGLWFVFIRPIVQICDEIRKALTLRWFGFTLTPAETQEPIGQLVATEASEVVTLSLAKPKLRIAEMAMAGSTLYASAARPVGAIMVLFRDSELTMVGCFFRYGDYLVTAKHVANQINAGIADVYLAGVVETRSGTFSINKTRPVLVSRELFDLDRNEFTSESLDVFARKLDVTTWGIVGIQKVSVKKPSSYNMIISSCGFSGGVLMSGCGKTQKIEGSALELGHTATTQCGFSGSPVFGGSSVVGMHVAGQSDHNVMIRIEAIKYFLRVEESSSSREVEYEEKYKYNGEPEEYYEEHDVRVGVTAGGRSRFVTEEELKTAGFDTTDKIATLDFKPKSGRAWADYDDDDDDDYVVTKYRKKESSGPSPRKVSESSHIIRCEDRTPVHCGRCPAVNSEVADYFADRKEEIEKLGYVEGEQAYPDINPRVEETSLVRHLELFEKRHKSVTQTPTQGEMDRVVNLLETMLSANKYEPKIGYKSAENIVRIIDSSLVNERKSAGVPYQGQGMATNGDVLRKIGKTGLAEIVHKEWDAPLMLKVIQKAEAAKRKKLDSGMPRVVLCFPVHKMIKNQALFSDMLRVSCENWKSSPIKYAFSPGNPGHIEHLARIFKDGVVECDKSNWDYNMFDYFYDIVARVIGRLAVQPADMSDEEFEQYRYDVRKTVEEVRSGAQFCCTNGHVYKLNIGGIMKSGWLLTIFVNSICQIVLDVLIKMRLGWTDEKVLDAGNVLVAGGDDTFQKFLEPVDLEQYKDEARKLGFELEFKTHTQFEGSEFFSNVFRKIDGVMGFIPVRITKHLEKLKRVKSADLSMALSSAMINYCWESRTFSFFERMYRDLRKSNPEGYPLSLMKSRNYLRYKCKGMEVAGEDEEGFVLLDEVLDDMLEVTQG